MAYLLVQSSRKMLDDKTEWTIGRTTANDIQLPDQLVSRTHAKLFWQADHLYLIDLGSRNGTFVNGRRVSKQVSLRHQDTIEIGTSRLQVCLEEVSETQTVSQEPPTEVNILERLTTILVVDIRGYCELSQKIPAYQLAGFISDWSMRCGLTAERYGAFSHKSIGDSVMATWVHNNKAVPDLLNVIHCMLDCASITKDLALHHGMEHKVLIGSGINTGRAMVGNNGSGGIQDFSPLGDAVNAAFRYEGATRQVGCDLLIGSSTADQVPFIKRLQKHQLVIKGYNDPHILYGSSYEELRGLINSFI
ncbi:family 3 adenylate cyclase [Leptolyngbyaceae cyanobacterium JSC-12]|nr:family 3 adenylate cyclase [Leptolyngbyaceae cyanobacterium JSC-12]